MAAFNYHTIIEMFRLSELIYIINSSDAHIDGPHPDLDEHNIRYGYTSDSIIKFVSIEKTDVQYCISTNSVQKRTCVIFRGTNSFTDWIYNLQYSQAVIKNNIYVHSGYLKLLFEDNLYHRIYEQINALVRQYPDNEIYLSGHSAGGAMATLLGYFLSKDMPDKKINVVTFGSPRVGNYGFKLDFTARSNLDHIRVVNKRDIIPLVPFFGYYHVGRKILIKPMTFKCRYCFCCCLDPDAHTNNSHFTSLMEHPW
jgi:predicted lipase